MAQDESDFEKLLKEAREWQARDRARHQSSAMNDDGATDPFRAAARAPAAGVDEPRKAIDPKRGQERQPAPKAEGAKPAASIKIALKSAVKQAHAQAATERATRKGNWGWIWVAILAYFVIKHFLAR